jgi:phenylpropionate dioxygenase-like ring-hydroxylating dioxygenase large terminal subunit
MHTGWCQIAFSAEVGSDLLPVQVGRRALMLARDDDGVHAYDATCPHRGANLSYGGRLDGGAVVCPFHGHRIRLGLEGRHPFCVRRYRTLDVGGAIYLLPEDHHDTGFEAFMEGLAASHWLVPGFSFDAAVAPEYVIENVFDAEHFVSVHGVNARPDLRWSDGEGGELVIDGVLRTDPGVDWHGPAGPDAEVELRFCAHVFSPTLVATELGPADLPNVVITSAAPAAAGHCTIRLVVAMPRADPKGSPTVDAIGSLLAGSRTAFEQDLAVWEHLDADAPSHFTPGDALVLTYRKFCARFGPAVG